MLLDFMSIQILPGLVTNIICSSEQMRFESWSTRRWDYFHWI